MCRRKVTLVRVEEEKEKKVLRYALTKGGGVFIFTHW